MSCTLESTAVLKIELDPINATMANPPPHTQCSDAARNASSALTISVVVCGWLR